MNAVLADIRPLLPTMLRSHKYGGRLMTQQEFRDREALSKAVGRFIGLAAHDAMSHSMHLRNRLHVDHNAHCLDEIPTHRLGEALDFVRSMVAEAEAAAATGERKAWRPIREKLKKDTPWIPWITRKYRERYGKEIGPNPDWRALYAELNGETIWRRGDMLDRDEFTEHKSPADAATHGANLVSESAKQAMGRIHERLLQAEAVMQLISANSQGDNKICGSAWAAQRIVAQAAEELEPFIN